MLIDSDNALDGPAASVETVIMDGDALSRCRLNLLVACRPQEKDAAWRLVVIAVEVGISSADATVEGPVRMSAPHDEGERRLARQAASKEDRHWIVIDGTGRCTH
jgi:hypothetical protein